MRSIFSFGYVRPNGKFLALLIILLICTASLAVLSNHAPNVYAAPSATLTEWTVPTVGSAPASIALDPSGNCCWFVEETANNVAHLDPATNTFQEWALPTASSAPAGIAPVSISGQTAIFGTEGNGNKIFILFPNGNIIKEYTLPTANSYPEYISVEPPGAQERAWFSEVSRNTVGELVYDPALSTADLYEGTLPPAAGGTANGVYAGPGTIWFAGASALVRFDRGTNQFSSWALPTHGSATGAFVAVDNLGQAWYTQDVPSSASDPNNYVGVLRGDGTFKDWQIPTAGADVRGISINPLTQQPWAAEYAHASSMAKVAALDPSTGGTVSYPGLPTTQAFSGSMSTLTPAVLGPFPPTTNTASPTSNSITATSTGAYTEWPLSPTSGPHDLVVDSSGNVWIAESNANKIAELTLTQPDFSLGAAPGTVSLAQGGSGMITVTGTSILGFSGAVTLSITGSVPSGVTFSTFSPNPLNIPSGGSAPATLTVNVGASAPVGSSTITITGTGASVSHSTTFTLTITSGADFSLSLSPPSISVGAGGSSGETVTVTSLGSFNSAVSLSNGALPSGVHIVFSPNPVTPTAGGTVTSTATVSVDPGTPAGSSPITITGTSGSLTHSQSFTLTIAVTPDFVLSAVPLTVSLTQGGGGTSAITVTSVNGFNSAVALSYSWTGSAPSGVTASLPGPVTPSSGTPATSTLSLTASSSSSTGSFTLQVTGMNGALSHSLNLGVMIAPAATSTSTSTTSTPSTPHCLIATATYGSPMAPEVQLLRNFRDNSLMKTQAGSSFMLAFNAWYYSFSPTVANYLQSHWVERTAMKAVLYPLIGILYLTSNLFAVTAAYPELATLLSGLLASSLIGGFYIGLPLSVIESRIRRPRASIRIDSHLAVLIIGAIGTLMLGELVSSSPLMMLSSVTVVLSTIALSALATSRSISRKLTKHR